MAEGGSERRAPRILLAEDELLVAADIEAMLVDLGCEVVGPAATVVEVERLGSAQPLDGAVLDVNLRGEPVFSAVPTLQRRSIPVVLSSGYHNPANFPEPFRELPILVKPYDKTQLAALLRAACGLANLI